MLHSYGIERPFTEESVLNSVIFHVLNLQRVITSELISPIFKIIVEITQLLSSSSLLRSSSSCLVCSWYDPVVALKFDDTTSLAPETHPKHIPNAHLFLNNQAVRVRCGIFSTLLLVKLLYAPHCNSGMIAYILFVEHARVLHVYAHTIWADDAQFTAQHL